MTTHHTIEIVATATFVRVTYRNGKFRKVEHLKGKINQQMLNHLGRIIPVSETEINDFIEKYQDKVHYTKEVKEKSIYQLFNALWFEFYIKQNGFSPKFTGADGRALKEIITYLKTISATDNEALTIWKLLLNNWHTLDEFHKKNCDLKYINSALNKILQNAKKSNKTSEQVFARAVQSEVGKNFKFK